jgi:hypothetical protein
VHVDGKPTAFTELQSAINSVERQGGLQQRVKLKLDKLVAVLISSFVDLSGFARRENQIEHGAGIDLYVKLHNSTLEK